MTDQLRIDGLCKHFGALQVTRDVSLDVRPGELHAVIGPNGAGKTTLINLLCGDLRPNAGRISLAGRDISRLPVHARARKGILRSYQITSVFNEFTVRENAVIAALGAKGHAFHFWRPMLTHAEAVRVADEALDTVNLLEVANVRVQQLSYGECRQLELAMALAARPDVLLLDEPMAGMSAADSPVVTRLLQSLKGRYTIVLVEHDMSAVFALADRITVLVYGSVLVTGTPEEIRNNAEVRATYLGEEERS